MLQPVEHKGLAWYYKEEQFTPRNTIHKVQSLACTCLTEAMRTCPTAALEVLSDLTHLHLVIERVAVELDSEQLEKEEELREWEVRETG